MTVTQERSTARAQRSFGATDMKGGCELRWKRAIAGVLIAAASLSNPAFSKDLGITGQVFEIIEEDFRLAMLRLVARRDWAPQLEELKESAENYTKNLTQYVRPRATKTKTIWKDAGVVVGEDIYIPWVDPETGSVFEPQPTLAVRAGTYLNSIQDMPSIAIPRLFVFDATDPEQLLLARALMAKNIENLEFMLVAGDLGPLSKEVNRPIYHPSSQMLEKFNVTKVPALIGFGRGRHQGHIATTEFAIPTSIEVIEKAWFGLETPGQPEGGDQ